MGNAFILFQFASFPPGVHKNVAAFHSCSRSTPVAVGSMSARGHCAYRTFPCFRTGNKQVEFPFALYFLGVAQEVHTHS